jgi:hypothetical protein
MPSRSAACSTVTAIGPETPPCIHAFPALPAFATMAASLFDSCSTVYQGK